MIPTADSCSCPAQGAQEYQRPPPAVFDGFESSHCLRPQLAHEMYQRLLAIAIRRQNHQLHSEYNSEDIRLAAYTGYGLYYSS